MRRDGVALLIVCFVFATASALVGQPLPAPPFLATLDELHDLRLQWQQQAYFPLRIETMTQDYFQFYLRKRRFEGIVEHNPAPTLVTLRKGDTLPGSCLVITDFTETVEKVNGIERKADANCRKCL